MTNRYVLGQHAIYDWATEEMRQIFLNTEENYDVIRALIKSGASDEEIAGDLFAMYCRTDSKGQRVGLQADYFKVIEALRD